MIADTFFLKKTKVYVHNSMYYGQPFISDEKLPEKARSFLTTNGDWRHYNFGETAYNILFTSIQEAKEFAESHGYEAIMV